MSSSNLLNDIYIYVNIYTEIFKNRPALAGIPVRLKNLGFLPSVVSGSVSA